MEVWEATFCGSKCDKLRFNANLSCKAHITEWEICQQLKKKRKPTQGPQSSSGKTNNSSQVNSPIQRKGSTHVSAQRPITRLTLPPSLLFLSDPLEWEDLWPQAGTDNPAHAKQTNHPRKTRLALGQQVTRPQRETIPGQVIAVYTFFPSRSKGL